MSVRANYKLPNIGMKWPSKITVLENGWGDSFATVTPQMAEAMLRTNVDNQRKITPSTVDRYAQDISSGSWKLTHQGIAFNAKGELFDGQHRLTAVVQSGVAVDLRVTFGVGGRPEMTVTDNIDKRDVYDAAKVQRIEITRKAAIPLWMAIRYGAGDGTGMKLARISQSRRLKLLNKYSDRLNAIWAWFGNTKQARAIGRSAFRGAIFCAYPHVDVARLERFVHVLTEQAEGKPGEGVCKQLRMIGYTQPKSNLDHEHFLKTCRAIQLFMNKQEVTKLFACDENPYPFSVDDN